MLLAVVSCKKDSVDATNTRTFQSSINDMQSGLNTLQQVKFNEALYILKTFGVEGETDQQEMVNLAHLLNGKKVPQIMQMADAVAQKNAINWSSAGPPTLGDTNIFEDAKAAERDFNDIRASGLALTTKPAMVDSVLGPKAILVIPRLVDPKGNAISFSGAALETQMDVFSNGSKLHSSKNLIQDNNFKGFVLRMAFLPTQRIADGKVDITVSVKTSSKTYKMTKVGVPVNTRALLMPQGTPAVADENPAPAQILDDTESPETETGNTAGGGDPKLTVTSFLNNLSSQNFQGAYSKADNPGWGSYETFANPTSGFGGVKNLNVKSISTANVSSGNASVNASYDVTDKEGKVTPLKVTFGLKNVNGEWKISSYKIN